MEPTRRNSDANDEPLNASFYIDALRQPEEFEPKASTQEMAPVTKKKLFSARPTGAAAVRRPPKVPLAPRKRLQAKFNPLADFAVYVVVFLGGVVGTIFRYGMWLWMPDDGPVAGFHPPTFLANMLACFIFALLTTYMTQASWIKKRARQLTSRGIGMGMCGGFSTLSAMMIEDITALHEGQYVGLFFYTIASYICGFAVAWFGSWLAIKITAKRSASLAVAALVAANQAKPAIGVRVPADPAIATGLEPAASIALDDHENVPAYIAPSFEPDPITDEIPVIPDVESGEVH